MINKLNLFFLFVLFVASCSSVPNNFNSTDSKILESNDSPTGVLRTFTEAKKSKDVEVMKSTLSSDTLETIKGVAEFGHNQTIDEYLKLGNTTPLNQTNMPSTRNENVKGDIATVEISRFYGDKWRKLTFVKENGKWKMDLNKFLDELIPSYETDDKSDPPPSK